MSTNAMSTTPSTTSVLTDAQILEIRRKHPAAIILDGEALNFAADLFAAHATPPAEPSEPQSGWFDAWFTDTYGESFIDLSPHAIAQQAWYAALRRQASRPSEAWRPMATAPTDGTLVRLLVAFTEHPVDDTNDPLPTIGANTSKNTGEDETWRFAGWSWEHDCFTQGEGTPLGWLPMLDAGDWDPLQVDGVEHDVFCMKVIRSPTKECTCGASERASASPVPPIPILPLDVTLNTKLPGDALVAIFQENSVPMSDRNSELFGVVDRALCDAAAREASEPVWMNERAPDGTLKSIADGFKPFGYRQGTEEWLAFHRGIRYSIDRAQGGQDSIDAGKQS